MRTDQRLPVLMSSVIAVIVSGCFSSAGAVRDVRRDVIARTGRQVALEDRAPARDGTLQQMAERRLRRSLDANGAVEVALVQSPMLQADLESLDVALADLLQASLVDNPDVELEATFPTEGNADPDLLGTFVVNLADVIRMPIRRSVADAELAAARAAAAGAVMDLAYRTRVAFYRHQADLQLVELYQQVVETLRASYEAASALRVAGNVVELDVMQQRALYEESRVALAQAELAAITSRERLQVTMGLSGAGTRWTVDGRLGDLGEPSETDPRVEDIEPLAIERSLELIEQRHRLEAQARRIGLYRTTGLIPALRAGVTVEREDGEWSVGPVIEMQLPLFDQGQGRVERGSAELRQGQHRYVHTAVLVRSSVRLSRARYLNARERARFYESTLLPVREQALEQTLLRYNAMALGVFQLLQARRALIDTTRDYVESLHDYWTSRAALEQVLAGRMVGDMGEVRIPSMGDGGGTGDLR